MARPLSFNFQGGAGKVIRGGSACPQKQALNLLKGDEKMKIRCEDIDALTQVCAGLVERGITFEANTTTLMVICTGGF